MPEPLDYESRLHVRRKADVLIWRNAGIGLATTATTVACLCAFIWSGQALDSPWRFAGLLLCLAAGFAAILLLIGWGKERGFYAGCLLGVGLVILCPIVAVVVICGNMRFHP